MVDHTEQEPFETLYEDAPCALLLLRPDGTITRANRTLLRWIGEDADALKSRRFSELLTIGGRIYVETHLAPLLRMQGEISGVQLELARRQGGALPVLFEAVERRDPEGRPLSIHVALFDLSERKRYERELLIERKRAEDAGRAKSEFISTLGHELRSPASAMVAAIGLLRRTELSPKQQRYLQILRRSSENMVALLNDLLDISKMEAGRSTLQERAVDLRQLAERTLHSQAGRAEEKRLELKTDIEPEVPAFVQVDPIKLGQVLTNLVTNAIKFTDRGSVLLSIRCLDRLDGFVRLEISVTDTGMGIPADRLARIFEAFTQANDQISAQFGGTGLGLTISQKLLALYGTRMQVRSAVGVGTTFSFPIRLQVAEAPRP